MSGLAVVLAKEVLENFRDRRTLLSALVLGPLFGPLLFAVIIGVVLDRTVSAAGQPLQLPVHGAEHAPNLVRFLEQQGIDVVPGPERARDAVRTGEHRLVLVIPPDFPERLRSGHPARVELISDNANTRTGAELGRVATALERYRSQLGALRLQARGVNPLIGTPLVYANVDVSTPAGRSLAILGMMTYFVLFSMLMGGFYLAIDSTAGERERGSLEPLLTLPVMRASLMLGKLAATCVYMLASLAITLTAFVISLSYVPLERAGMTAELGPLEALIVFLLMLPFAPLGAALMTTVASFTRSYREAQSWLTAVLLLPTVPIIFAAIYSLKPATGLMVIPSLSQHLLITTLLRGEDLSATHVLVSASSTLAVATALAATAVWLYTREELLG